MNQRLTVMTKNGFFEIDGAQIGESDLCATDDLTWRMVNLGVVPQDLPEKTQRKINRTITARFIELGLEPIHFQTCTIGWYWIRGFQPAVYAAHTNKQEDEYRDFDTLNHSRPGITVNSGKTVDAWERHTIARYVAEGDSFPRQAVEVLEKLADVRLPIGASVMVWTPDRLTRMITGPAPDPLLVVEFGNGLCVPLCRWND